MKALLDTCVISELVSKRPHSKVVEYVDALDPEDVYLSVITIGEIVKGIEKLPPPAQGWAAGMARRRPARSFRGKCGTP